MIGLQKLAMEGEAKRPMPISQRVKVIVWVQAKGLCSFPPCRRELVLDAHGTDTTALIGEVAHIIAESVDGPRGKSHLTVEQRNQPDNLILLCPTHHMEIDSAPQTYPVERLREIKRAHLKWVREKLRPPTFCDHPLDEDSSRTRETLHSTILPVLRLPERIYAAPPRTFDTPEIDKALSRHDPYVIYEQQLLTFEDLRKKDNSFADVINWHQATSEQAKEWWEDPDKYRLYVYLLGHCLNKIAGRRKLKLDKEHNRYYFAPPEPGKELEISYTPLNISATKAKVVWQPVRKSTGEPYGYWLHRAVQLRFFKIDGDRWVLSLRPEYRVTKDGVNEYESSEIGEKVTHKKAHMYNKDLLTEVNFWRWYLSDGTPRIAYRCDRQALVIGSTLLQTCVDWPGVPSDFVSFKNVELPENLFSLGEADAIWKDDTVEEDEWTEDESQEEAVEP
jgi:hypothetical protein